MADLKQWRNIAELAVDSGHDVATALSIALEVEMPVAESMMRRLKEAADGAKPQEIAENDLYDERGRALEAWRGTDSV